MENAETAISAITGLKPKEVEDAIRWFSRQAISTQIAVFREPVILNYSRFAQNGDSPKARKTVPAEIRRFAAFVLSAFRVMSRETAILRRKNYERDLTAHDELHQARVQAVRELTRRRKKSPKEEAVRVRLPQIKHLREVDGLTWRQVSAYLRMHGGLSVSPGYLHSTVSRLMGLEAIEGDA